MWAAIKRHPIAAFLSLALHVGLLVLITFKLNLLSPEEGPVWIDLNEVVANEKKTQVTSPQADTPQTDESPTETKQIKALALDAAAIDQEIIRIKAAEAAKKKAEEDRLAALKKAEQDLVKTRQVEQANLAKLNKEKVDAEQKRQEAAQARAKEEALLAQAAQNKEILEEEARLQKLQAEADAAAQKAEQARLAKIRSDQLNKLRNEYYKQIQAKVRNEWRRPLNTKSDWSCQIEVTQDRAGQVLGVVVKNNTGTAAFESTVKSAVLKASPLPKAPTPDLFEARIIFTFKADN